MNDTFHPLRPSDIYGPDANIECPHTRTLKLARQAALSTAKSLINMLQEGTRYFQREQEIGAVLPAIHWVSDLQRQMAQHTAIHHPDSKFLEGTLWRLKEGRIPDRWYPPNTAEDALHKIMDRCPFAIQSLVGLVRKIDMHLAAGRQETELWDVSKAFVRGFQPHPVVLVSWIQQLTLCYFKYIGVGYHEPTIKENLDVLLLHCPVDPTILNKESSCA